MISVIIPVYNAEKFLSRCIESVISQSYSNWELILVDDGSTDNSNNICKQYAEMDTRITLISKKNGGVSSARNFGLDLCRGDYVTFVDSDDEIKVDLLNDLITSIKKYDSDISICGMERAIGNRRISYKLNDKLINGAENIALFINDYFKQWVVSAPWGKMYKKELIGNIRFNEDMTISEDLDFNLRYYREIKRLSLVESDAYIYYNNANSLINTYRKEDYDCVRNTCKYASDMLKKVKYNLPLNNIYSKLIEYSRFCIIENFGLSTKKEQKDFINKILSDSEIKDALTGGTNGNIKNEIYAYFYRTNRIELIFIFSGVIYIFRHVLIMNKNR